MATNHKTNAATEDRLDLDDAGTARKLIYTVKARDSIALMHSRTNKAVGIELKVLHD
jgi:hypothetical protein